MRRIQSYFVILTIFIGSEAATAAAAEQRQSVGSASSYSRGLILTSSQRELSKHRHHHHGHDNEQHPINNKNNIHSGGNGDKNDTSVQQQTPSQNNVVARQDDSTLGVVDEQQQSERNDQQQMEENQPLQQQQQQQQNQETIRNTDYSIFACDELPNLQQKANDAGDETSFDQCEFAINCNDGDGILFSHFFFCNSSTKTTSSSIPTSTTSSSHPLFVTKLIALLLLFLALLLLFRLLSSTTDEFFSPGLEMFSLRLGLPPRFAGVTLLALGNGAPDVAATMNAMLAGSRGVGVGDDTGGVGVGGGREGYGMALGELTGTCMFNICLILGAIVIYLGSGSDSGRGKDNKNKQYKNGEDVAIAVVRGVPCQGPLLRDISVLIIVCVVSMSYLKSGVIDHEFVYTMLGIYVSYVLVVLSADAYHIFYHVPLLADALRRSSSSGSGFSLNEPTPSDDETGAAGDLSVADEQTPLTTALPPLRCDTVHRHFHHRNSSSSSLPPHHRHTIGETVIEAISNYSCVEESIIANHAISGRAEHTQLIEAAASLREEEGWAPIFDDGNEPLVIFHPNHAVHPHHHHIHRPSDGPVLFLRSDSSTGKSAATRRPTLCVGDNKVVGAEENTISIDEPSQSTLTATMKGDNNAMNQINNNRPSSWKDAWSSNFREFIEHWRDFFTDIYSNEANSTLDVIFLSVELPFTIARKVRFSSPLIVRPIDFVKSLHSHTHTLSHSVSPTHM
jgi:hypothetical protein